MNGAEYLRKLKAEVGSGEPGAPEAAAPQAPAEESKPAMPERRASQRYACQGSVRFRQAGSEVHSWGTFSDISLHGCYIEVTATFPLGVALELCLELNGVRAEMNGEVRVSYPFLGMGIAFREISAENRQRLTEMVRSISRGVRVVSRPPAAANPGAEASAPRLPRIRGGRWKLWSSSSKPGARSAGRSSTACCATASPTGSLWWSRKSLGMGHSGGIDLLSPRNGPLPGGASMARLPALLIVVLLVVLSTSCGGYYLVAGAINPGTQTVIGFVTIVQLQLVNGFSSVTVVTLVGNGMAQTLPFCGDQRSQFPMDRTVSARFTPGSSCNTLVAATVN